MFVQLLLVLSFIFVNTTFASPPVRTEVYSTNETILSDDVTANEDSIFNYLQNGVEVYADGTIVNADVATSANIQSDKLNLSSINQTIPMSAATFSFAKGSDVASTAAMTLGSGNIFDITGTTTITSITAGTAGTIVLLQFDSSLTVTDGSNLLLAGNFSATANDTMLLYCDGTNWFEIARSAN